ncbi:MAG TPA: hypothetical protein PLE30_05440 [Candidatus Kapabacteria bacterium]|nr:hypothetical protein [Candidatus Kapabacteria bacterium]
MRVTFKSPVAPYLSNLERIQNRKHNEELRISTGDRIQSLADEPANLVDSKQLASKVAKNKTYISNIEESLNEMRLAHESVDFLSSSLQKVRELAVDATQIGVQGDSVSLAVYVKGILEDMVKEANKDLGGRYIFSGTKTLPNTIDINPPATNNQPYEIINVAKTTENPSGLDIVFKGNNNERIMNKDNYSTEVVNTTSDKLFGSNLEGLKSVIDLYNVLYYKQDGSPREKHDQISQDEFNKLNLFQKNIADNVERLNKVNADFGAKINRLELVQSQFETNNIRLNEIKSLKSDTDVAQSAINLKMEENALNYSLQIGSKLVQNSLFDFLT